LRPTLLFLPGTLCDARLWEQQQALLPDWPSVIASYGLASSISAMARKALTTVSGPVIPVGCSMGGIVALEMWRLEPARIFAMALFDTNPGADTAERAAARLEQQRAGTPEAFAAMVGLTLAPNYFARANASSENLRELVMDMATSQGPMVFASQCAALTSRADSWPLLAGITVPVLVASGSEDRVCPPDRQRDMAGRLPDAIFRLINDAGHLPMIERPAETMSLLREWLARLPP
jgi:pimeloyl-ACP methyl ester carboxylesterase